MKMVIAIDPGHGMGNVHSGVYDSGAVGNGQQEASVVLGYGLDLAKELVRRGFEVFLTRRDAAAATPVKERATNAQKAGAALFVSLHLNSSDSSEATGTETIYRDGADATLAACLQKRVVAVLGLHDRGLKSDLQGLGRRLAVFGFGGPAALIELGFVSNPDDLARLLNRRDRAVIALADGIEEYLRTGGAGAAA